MESSVIKAMRIVQHKWICCFEESPRSIYLKYKAIVEFYGGRQNLCNLNASIKKELQLFDEALANEDIFMTILDVIQDMDPRFCTCCDYSLNMSHGKNIVFSTFIWEKYLRLGGNYHVIIYGLFEYLCMFHEPTSKYICGFLEMMLVRNSVLKKEILSHKNASGC